jgi:hypothetical protein
MIVPSFFNKQNIIRKVCADLNTVFPGKWIEPVESIPVLPFSLDFSLWGYMKDVVYVPLMATALFELHTTV